MSHFLCRRLFLPKFPDKQQSYTAFATCAGFEPATLQHLSIRLTGGGQSFFLWPNYTQPNCANFILPASWKPRPICTGHGTNPKKPNYVFKIPAATFDHRVHI